MPLSGAENQRASRRSSTRSQVPVCGKHVDMVRTLEELNRHWSNYLEEYYHKTGHDGIRKYYESQGVTVPAEGITKSILVKQ